MEGIVEALKFSTRAPIRTLGRKRSGLYLESTEDEQLGTRLVGTLCDRDIVLANALALRTTC